MLTRLRARRDRNDHGQTLIELIVVMTILTGLMTAVVGTLINSSRNVRQDQRRLDQAQQATVAGEAISKTLRTAVLPRQLNGTCTGCDVAAFISGGPRTASFYANLNNNGTLDASGKTTDGPSKVTYAVASDGTLTETVQRTLAHLPNDYNFQWCDLSVSTCARTTRVLARGVSTTGTLFTYYDKTGATLATPLESSATTLAAVDSVELSLNVRSSTEVPGTTLETRVTMPNADTAVPPQLS